jgi:hypothetical protein
MSSSRFLGAAWASVHGPSDPLRMLRWLCESGFAGVVPSPSPRPMAFAAIAAAAHNWPVSFPAVRCSSILSERPTTAGLASLRDGEVRASFAAVDAAVALAASVEARCVLLEPGIVPLMGEIEREDLGDSRYDWTPERVQALAARRKAVLPAALDRVCRQLFAIARRHPDFTFCLTQSRSLLAVASLESLQWIYEDLPNLRLGYWHDAGIAARREQLLSEPQGAWLEAFGSRCRGANLGDARAEGLYLPPGAGAVDYGLVAAGLKPLGKGASLCLELDPAIPPGELPGMGACLDKFGL